MPTRSKPKSRRAPAKRRRSARNPSHSPAAFAAVVREVAALSQANHHTASVQLIASEFFPTNKRLAAALNGIAAIADYYGYAPPHLSEVREGIAKKMEESLKTMLTPAQFRALHMAR